MLLRCMMFQLGEQVSTSRNAPCQPTDFSVMCLAPAEI